MKYQEQEYEVSREGAHIIIRSKNGEKKLHVGCGSIEETLPAFLVNRVRKCGLNPDDYFSFNATPIRKGALSFVRAAIIEGEAEIEASLTEAQRASRWREAHRGVMSGVERDGDINKFAQGGAL